VGQIIVQRKEVPEVPEVQKVFYNILADTKISQLELKTGDFILVADKSKWGNTYLEKETYFGKIAIVDGRNVLCSSYILALCGPVAFSIKEHHQCEDIKPDYSGYKLEGKELDLMLNCMKNAALVYFNANFGKDSKS
jgi:hypothetical protein